MSIKKNLLFATFLLFANIAYCQFDFHYTNPDDQDFTESCTSIMVGKQASDDGSVMTAHTCDSNYRTWLSIEKRKKYKKLRRFLLTSECRTTII